MSAAITPWPGHHDAAPVHARLGGLRFRLRRLGRGRVVACGFGALLAWGFVGSLAMGLRNPAMSSPASAVLWLAGLAAIAVPALAAALLAGRG